MQYELTSEGERRLTSFVDRIGTLLGHRGRRQSFAIYALGLLGEGERKSIEPIAARACADPRLTESLHDRLTDFVTDSIWSDHDVRLEAARYAIPAITQHDPISVWIVDDTGMLKQGSHSVGVQRQYTGSAGKITNCQIAVSLSVAHRREHLPIDFDLYLPRCWTSDRARRKEARIPRSVRFRTKIVIGLDMIRRAVKAGIPKGVVLADSAYGDSVLFRKTLRQLDLHYAVGVSANIKVWRADKFEVCRGGKIAVKDLATQASKRKAFRRITWKQGTKAPLSARFAFRRVVPCRSDGVPPEQREVLWLITEWEDGRKEPTKYHLSSLPRDTRKKKLVRLLKLRWRTERVYEDLKGELGFDHFEGRRYPGWQHHVSVVLCCYAFVAAERAIAFSPSAGDEVAYGPVPLAARAPLSGFVHHRPPRRSTRLHAMAAPLSSLPPVPEDRSPPADATAITSRGTPTTEAERVMIVGSGRNWDQPAETPQ
jgi:SRSO17 transposase